MNLASRWCSFYKFVSDDTFKIILDPAYSEPHRKYHNLQHIEASLNELDRHVVSDSNCNLSSEKIRSIELAIWFHDAVYNTHSRTNEFDSSQLLLKECCSHWWFRSIVDLASKMILATEHHSIPHELSDGDRLACQYFIDIDLSVLGLPEEEYSRYEKGIREEFGWAPDDAFAAGRCQALHRFLDREWIYNTKKFRRLYEGPARDNMNRSIIELEKQS